MKSRVTQYFFYFKKLNFLDLSKKYNCYIHRLHPLPTLHIQLPKKLQAQKKFSTYFFSHVCYEKKINMKILEKERKKSVKF